MDPIARIYKEFQRIAIVGASNNPERPSYEVAQYLQEQGFEIIPVNPALTQLFGAKAYPDLLSIPGPVEVVDIFRNPDAVPDIVEQAIARQAKVVWMQPGAENAAAAERADQAGLEVVMGICMMRKHRALEKEGKL
jgi:hypothetical protein